MLSVSHEALVRRNRIEALCKYVDTELLRDVYTELTGKPCRIQSKLKLARQVKQLFVNDYKNVDLCEMIKNVMEFDTIHCVTFQREDVLDMLTYEGIYVPSERYASEPNTSKAVIESLGYYPVWLVNPLMLGQRCVDKDAFTVLPFMNYLQTAFPMHRYNVGKDFVLMEFEFDARIITTYNSSTLCTCVPMLKMSNLMGVYKFYLNDPECGYKNTYKYPYIKVVKTFGNDVLCMSDYESATCYGAYTGTDSDFDL